MQANKWTSEDTRAVNATRVECIGMGVTESWVRRLISQVEEHMCKSSRVRKTKL